MRSKQRGPLEIVEAKGLKIPIYKSIQHGRNSFLVVYYADGKRVRERLNNVQEARTRAKRVIETLTNGSAHVAALSARETAVVNEALELLREIGVSLTEAVRQFAESHKILDGKGTLPEAARAYVSNLQRDQITPKRLGQVVEEFTKYIETAGLSWQYQRDMRSRLKQAAVAFGTNIGDIRTEEIDAWLSRGNRAPRTVNNDRSALVALFNFAKKKAYLPRTESTAADAAIVRKDVRGKIGILKPAELKILFEQTPDKFKPMVALGGLAGLRMAEISRITWEEIHLDQGHLVIEAAKAKTASRRSVPICDALKSWLSLLSVDPNGKRRSGKVMPFRNEQSMLNSWSKTKAKYVTVKIPQNALRHSSVSYLLADLEDAQKVALRHGNSPDEVHEHYKELVSKAAAKEWFSVGPPIRKASSKTRSGGSDGRAPQPPGMNAAPFQGIGPARGRRTTLLNGTGSLIATKVRGS